MRNIIALVALTSVVSAQPSEPEGKVTGLDKANAFFGGF